MTRLAVVGSHNADLTLLADHLPTPGDTVVVTSPALVSWGGRAATRPAAAAFGAAVTMVGKAGDDQQGRQLLTDLAARGVDGSGVIVASGARAGGATIAVDGDGENLILVDPGANSLLSPDEVETAGLPAAEAVIVQLEIPLPTVAAAMSAAADAIVLTKWRLARSLAGTADVVVTLGSRGALVVCRSAATSVHIAALPAAAVDTTGAGNCFCDTLAASLAEGQRNSRVVTTAR